LQDHLLALRDKAHYQCPFAISYQVNTHLENLAPINGSLYVTPTNGLDNARARTSTRKTASSAASSR
jgi:multiple sugar transport system substrate-binding protein